MNTKNVSNVLLLNGVFPKIFGNTPDNNDNTLETKVIVQLKYLNNFLRFLNLPLINYEIELHLS